MAAASVRTTALPAALGGVVLGGVVLSGALLLGGCGSDSGDTAGTVPSGASPSATSSQAVGAPPSGTAQAPASPDPSARAVPGPRLPSATSVPASKAPPTVQGARCDTANGPEGALRVVVFPGGSADCAAVMPVARRFGPLISAGRDQDVDGWTCGPSQVTGVLAQCTRGSDMFGFVPQ